MIIRMVSKILHTSYIIDFIDNGFDSKRISNVLESKTDENLKSISVENLIDWKIQFMIIYGNKFPIRIFKKNPSYKKDKMKLITVHIPIPLNNAVEWGVDPCQCINIVDITSEDKFASYLDVDFCKFDNRAEYIIESIERSIDYCLKDGFSINGIKIKL